MIDLLLIAVPIVAAGLAYVIRARGWNAALLLGVAIFHSAVVLWNWTHVPVPADGSWIGLDDLGLIVLSVSSAVFLCVAVYAAALLRVHTPRGGRGFIPCLLAFLGATSLVALSQHLALLWIGLEATTLSLAPLIYSRRDRPSLEAVWKYLVLSSVGIAFALLAVFLLANAQAADPAARPLLLSDLTSRATHLDSWWLRAAYVFALAGFGTKMGLAPLHTWKPDAYGQAPSLVGGLLAGTLTTCAFLGVARFTQIATAAGLERFVRPLLIAAGLLSLVIAAGFIIGQSDVKRMLAYSSVEHMGLLVIGLGVGGIGVYGSVLHMINNGLIKGALFLAVGNLVLAAGTAVAADMRGMRVVRPASALLVLAGLFAITGSPPFGLFLSEFSIIDGALQQHHPWVAAVTVLMLAVIFVGLSRMIIGIVYGTPSTTSPETAPEREGPAFIIAPTLLTAAVLLFGLYLPPSLHSALARAAASLGGHSP